MKVLDNPLKAKDYRSEIEPTWCPGCGDFGVVTGLTRVMSELKMDYDNVVAFSGIGCSSRLPLWLRSFGFHSCHGRALPVAVGTKIANPELTVVVTVGDGDMFSIGAGHVPHAVRRNFDITVFCMDNHIYALTKNQVSPTSRTGKKGSLTPYGTLDKPINPIELMITYGSTFVAQTYTGNMKHTIDMTRQAILHKGFSFVNMLSPCPTYNLHETFKYYKSRVYNINEEENIEVSNRLQALGLAGKGSEHLEDEEARIPIGVFYKSEEPIFTDRIKTLKSKYATLYGSPDNPNWDKLFDQYAVQVNK